ncbi:MAG: PKD domain-containing protein [Nitrospiraceae bacterium]|nr:MAG: PKD domain-containing protein [Nitrospiraceae bacterium]
MTELPAKRGCHAFLRVILAVLLVVALFAVTSPVFSQEMPFTLDFEAGDLRGWTKTGNAFDFQPTLDDNPTARERGQPSQHQGRYWVGTYERYQGKRGQKAGGIQGDGPTGTLTSVAFTISKGTLSFLVGGGSSSNTRVELLVLEGTSEFSERQVLSVSGKNTETMTRVTWDLAPYAGKRGKIKIVDASSSGWGHINADDFRFTSRQTGTADGPARPQALIAPSFLKVTRGEKAVFESRSTHDPGIALRRQIWTGPGSQQGEGGVFTVATDDLAPGTYRIGLTGLGDHEQGDKASATLEVAAPAYRVSLNAEPTKLLKGQTVRFRAVFVPELSGVEFLFTFGDNTESGWTRDPGIVHTYSSSGVFSVSVAVRYRERIIAGSEKIRIQVTEPSVQSTLSLRANRQKVRVNERVLFNATLSPPQANAQYLFSFGDFEVSNWTGQPVSEHVYRKEGTYRALATASVKGETIAESSPVSIVVENIVEKPVARIEPSQATVTQGERVIFASRSVPEGAIRERWKGPGNQQGTGQQFEVGTKQLGPGKYRIVLEVHDRHGQNDRVEATLVVVSPPPATTAPATTAEPKRFTLLMDAQPLPARQSENVTFSARIEPGDETTEYRFFFGDGNIQEWSREARAVHVYAAAGSYHAFAAARIGQEVVAESVPVVVSVEVKGGKQPSRIPWGEIIAGLLIASGYYVFSRIRKMRKKLSATRSVLHIRPVLDSGEQDILGNTHIGAGSGIRLKPVTDPGEPEIETKGLLTGDERRDNA